MVWLRWLIQRPILVWSAGLVTVAAGLWARRTMPVDILPDLNYPLVNIVTQIPGASPEDVELLVTRPIENALKGSLNLVQLSSVTIPGMSRITAAFSWGTDALAAREVVATRLARVQSSLPPNIVPHMENLGVSLLEVAGYRVVGPQDPMILDDWARYSLAPVLASIPGVADIVVMGAGHRAFRVDADSYRLAAAGLTLADLQAALQDSDAFGTGRSINEFGRSLSIQLDGRVKSVRDVANVVVGRDESGQPLRLGEVATISDAPLPQAYVTTADGYPAALFTVLKQPGASTLDVCRHVQDALQARRDTFPEGVTVEPYYQQSDILSAVFGSLRNNLWQGGLMAALALLFVFGRGRVTILLLLAMPLSILFALVWMTALDLGLNLMTLAALVVVVGMIVDDAVIVVDSIARHCELGRKQLSAVIDGTREIMGPDFSGTLTTMAALGPLVLLSGLAGHFAAPFAWSFVAVLAGSLLFSLTVVPVGMFQLLKRGHDASARKWSGRGVRFFTVWNDRMLGRLLRHRRLTVAAVAVMFVASGALLSMNPVRGIPDLDERTFLVSVILPPGTALSEADRVGGELERRFLRIPHVTHTTRRTGSPESSYLIEGPNHSEIIVALDREGSSLKQRDVVRAQLAGILDRMPGLVYRINEPTIEKIDESLAGTPAVFGITLVGPDTAELIAAAAKVEAAAARVPGVSNVINNTKVSTSALHLEVDREAAGRFSLTPADVVSQLETALGGRVITQAIVGERIIPLFLRLRADLRSHPEDVLLRTPTGAIVPAGQVVTAREIQTPPTIEHLQGARSLTMPAELAGNPFRITADLRRAIDRLKLPKDLHVSFTGQLPTMIEAGIRLAIIVAVSLVLIFTIMALQFRSLLDPFVILLKVPIDVMGGAFALWITRQPLDITVVLGVVTLAGVSVNNGIVLVDFIRRRREQGSDVQSAIRDAVAVRFRPIMLTGLTTIFALIPAAVGWGRGPALLAPLGTFVAGGLLVGMLLTVNVLPVLYLSLDRFRRRPLRAEAW
jgi:CzcA family heavy metal efflux pump